MTRFVLVLHSHLPYVRAHGMWPFGEETLYEAIAEVYLPLARMLERLEADRVPAPMTIGITPILTEQLADAKVKEGFLQYCQDRLMRAEDDLARYQATDLAASAAHQAAYWHETCEHYQRLGGDVVGFFARAQERGQIEVITSSATHGYSPLLGSDTALWGQIKTGTDAYRRHYRREATGYWMPEMAYRPKGHWEPPVEGAKPGMRAGVDELLYKAGIRYTFVDAHLVQGGQNLPPQIGPYGQLESIQLVESSDAVYQVHELESGLRVMARNQETALQVWSADYGYPGDGAYREFHRKDPISGLHHHRVTHRKAGLGEKEPYYPDEAFKRTKEHARHFVSVVEGLAQKHPDGVICAAYDAELFGHWWYEGPAWLEAVFRELARSKAVKAMTAREAVRGKAVRTALPEGSWGRGGHHDVWLNRETHDFWRLVYRAEYQMVAAVQRFGRDQNGKRRALRQLMRELLLLESSDWPFLIDTGQAVEYARERYEDHAARFAEIYQMLRDDRIDIGRLAELEALDNPFPEADPSLYAAGDQDVSTKNLVAELLEATYPARLARRAANKDAHGKLPDYQSLRNSLQEDEPPPVVYDSDEAEEPQAGPGEKKMTQLAEVIPSSASNVTRTRAKAPAEKPKPAKAKAEPEAKTAKPEPAARDVFTQIKGIGPTYQNRLYEAGVLTFAQLAKLKPAKLLEIVQARVKVDAEGWIAEAKALSKRKK